MSGDWVREKEMGKIIVLESQVRGGWILEVHQSEASSVCHGINRILKVHWTQKSQTRTRPRDVHIIRVKLLTAWPKQSYYIQRKKERRRRFNLFGSLKKIIETSTSQPFLLYAK